MKNPLLNITESCAHALANRDFQSVWQLLAPWLQAQVSPELLGQYAQRAVLRTCQQAGLPTTWPMTYIVSGLGEYSLRSLQRSAPQALGLTPLSPYLNEKNYRGLMLVSLRPEVMGEIRLDVWTDFWFVVAEIDGKLCIAHLQQEQLGAAPESYKYPSLAA